MVSLKMRDGTSLEELKEGSMLLVRHPACNNDRMYRALKECIEKAVKTLYDCDEKLLCYGDKDIHNSERGIVFHFGGYLKKIVAENDEIREYYAMHATDAMRGGGNYSVDCDYNRNLDVIKRSLRFKNGTYPDLIVHERQSDNCNNLLIAEFKCWWSRKWASVKNRASARGNHEKENTYMRDIKKIEDFMDPSGGYRYKFGLFAILAKKIESMKWLECELVRDAE